jgi:hypothetical protein
VFLNQNPNTANTTKGYLARDQKVVHCTDCETDSTPIFVRLATISLRETSVFLHSNVLRIGMTGFVRQFYGRKTVIRRRLLIDLNQRGGGAPATSLHQD